MNTPKQQWHLGDQVTIDGNLYTITQCEYQHRMMSDKIEIWYRLLGPVSMIKYEDELNALVDEQAHQENYGTNKN